MKRGRTQRSEQHTAGTGTLLRDFILGGQDGLVNVLGLILGVATATQDRRFIIIAGLSALFAESISMGAVAYTSSKAQWDFYRSERAREKREITHIPKEERNEIRDIYQRKGFRGTLLNAIVNRITSDKKLWLETMMVEELRLFPDEYQKPAKTGGIVFAATIIGSLIPLLPYFFWNVGPLPRRIRQSKNHDGHMDAQRHRNGLDRNARRNRRRRDRRNTTEGAVKRVLSFGF